MPNRLLIFMTSGLILAAGLASAGVTAPASAADPVPVVGWWRLDVLQTDKTGSFFTDTRGKSYPRMYVKAGKANKVVLSNNHPTVAADPGLKGSANLNPAFSATAGPAAYLEAVGLKSAGPVTIETWYRMAPGVFENTYYSGLLTLTSTGHQQFDPYITLNTGNALFFSGWNGVLSEAGWTTFPRYTGTAGPDPSVDGGWHHFAEVYDDSSGTGIITAYIDGMEIGASPLPGKDVGGRQILNVGYQSPAGPTTLIGEVSEVRVTGAALTPAQFLR